MKKIICCSIFICATLFVPAQTNANKIALGVAPFSKGDPSIKDSYKSEVEEKALKEANSTKNLTVVPRSLQVLENIATEKNIQTQAEWLNASVLAETGKQIGATHLLTGKVVKISDEPGPDKTVLGVTVHSMFITIVLSVQIINVSTGVIEKDEEIKSEVYPYPTVLGKEKAISMAINKMGKKINDTINAWFSTKS